MSSAASLPNHTFTGQAKSSKRLTSIVHILSPETEAGSFKSRKFSLYQEIETDKPGPNHAAVNMLLQTGFNDMPIGNKKARVLLPSTDVLPPTLNQCRVLQTKLDLQLLNSTGLICKRSGDYSQISDKGLLALG